MDILLILHLLAKRATLLLFVMPAIRLAVTGPTVFVAILPHKYGDIPLGALPKKITNKLTGIFYAAFFLLSAKQGRCE